WDLQKPQTGAVSQAYPPETRGGFPLAFSPNLSLVAIYTRAGGSVPNGGFQIVVQDLARQREVARFQTIGGSAVTGGQFAGYGNLFLEASSNRIAMWDTLTAKSITPMPKLTNGSRLTAATCSPDGRLIAWAETIPPTAVMLRMQEGGTKDRPRALLPASAISPDQSTAAQALIRVYDVLADMEVARFSAHHGQVFALSMNLDGKQPMLVSGSQDTTILLWDLKPVMEKLRTNTPSLDPQQIEAHWTELGSPDPGRVQRAVWKLATAQSESLAILQERIKPVPVDEQTSNQIAQLVLQMDDDQFTLREQASEQAAALGENAEPFLREALQTSESAEVRYRIRQLLDQFAAKPLVVPVDQLRAIRAVQILQQVNSPEARELLKELSTGAPEARLTQAAVAALESLPAEK
ncbi:MAG: hypothetical protein SGJ20_07540, partial [Planctomycetota bacterium]|nr:hypothetical protein [Planctomycetota bacterium]